MDIVGNYTSHQLIEDLSIAPRMETDLIIAKDDSSDGV